MSALFGELQSIAHHTAITAFELPDEASTAEHVVALRMATYGGAGFDARNVSRVAHLNDVEIEQLLQLALKLRNDDIHVSYALERLERKETADLRRLKARLASTSRWADRLAEALAARNKRLRRLKASAEPLPQAALARLEAR